MTIQRMDNVLIVVDDLEVGRWVDRVVGLDDVRADIAMMRAPDGHSRLELTKFHAPPARTSTGSASYAALRASSSGLPSSSADRQPA
jgi:hypothetical protein